MGTREAKVEQYLTESIEARGGLCLKWVSPGNAGVPDRLVVLPGHTPFAVEVKTVDGRMSRQQSSMRTKLQDAGMFVSVVYGRKEVDTLMEAIDADTE